MSKQADFYRQIASPKNRELFDDLLTPFEIEPPSEKVTEREVLFNRFKGLAYRVKDCGAVVQNEGQTITKKELTEWSKIATITIVDFSDLLRKTREFLEK